ncbi:MAG: BON domain-containing protein [Planctomycetota bacterium]|nr:BON domain-containing protein [Planctomycetota bacterium]
MARQIFAVLIGVGLTWLWGASSYGQGTLGTTGTQSTGFSLGATMNTGPQRFLGGDRSTAAQFAGGTNMFLNSTGTAQGGAAGAVSPMGQVGMMGGMNPMGTLNALMANNMINNLSRQRRPLRMPITLGIEPTPALMAAAEPTHVGERVQSKLVKIPQVRSSGSVKVEMEGKIAVLRGEVKSQRERDLIGRMLLLEPGISDVRNELVVAPPVPSP